MMVKRCAPDSPTLPAAQDVTQRATQGRLLAAKLRQQRKSFASHNLWTTLISPAAIAEANATQGMIVDILDEIEDLNGYAQQFIETVHTIAAGLGATASSGTSQRKQQQPMAYCLMPLTKRAIGRRRALANELVETGRIKPTEVQQLEAQHQQAVAEARRLIKKDQKMAWNLHPHTICGLAMTQQMKDY